MNARFVSSCVCGLRKGQSVAISGKDLKLDDELKVVEVLKEYKALYDAGVITEEELNAKKQQLLGK